MDVVAGGDIHFGRRRVRLGEMGGSMNIAPSMTVEAFMLSMLAGLPDPRCAQCVREQGPLTVVGGQMDDVATARRALSKHNSYGFGTISTHLPTTPSDLAYARVATLHLPLPVLARAATWCSIPTSDQCELFITLWSCENRLQYSGAAFQALLQYRSRYHEQKIVSCLPVAISSPFRSKCGPTRTMQLLTEVLL